MPTAVITITDDGDQNEPEGAMMVHVQLDPPPAPGEVIPMTHLAAQVCMQAITDMPTTVESFDVTAEVYPDNPWSV
jgi:hypothetical protein